jgi:hypothetical protein
MYERIVLLRTWVRGEKRLMGGRSKKGERGLPRNDLCVCVFFVLMGVFAPNAISLKW